MKLNRSGLVCSPSILFLCSPCVRGFARVLVHLQFSFLAVRSLDVWHVEAPTHFLFHFYFSAACFFFMPFSQQSISLPSLCISIFSHFYLNNACACHWLTKIFEHLYIIQKRFSKIIVMKIGKIRNKSENLRTS